MLIWLDIETTGLDSFMDNILEVGLCFTNDFGEQISTVDTQALCVCGDWSIKDSVRSKVIDQPEEPLTLADNFVKDMHENSGLFEEIRSRNSPIGSYLNSLERLNVELIGLLKDNGADKKNTYFAGNSVHFDVSFFKAQLSPAIFSLVSHRLLDMSGVSLFCQSLDIPRPPKIQAHRVTEDIKESIGYFRHYREKLMFWNR